MTDNATSFGRAAEHYDRARPEYPAEAVDWLLPEEVRLVADVGAGTGKLTGVIAATGRTVVAIDPDAAMLDRLTARHPGIRTSVGTAESIPLEDASVDAVTFGQAWHWVDVDAASAEVGRVLRPGGVLGLVWNVRDTTVPWVAELGEAMGASNAERLISGDRGVGVAGPFSRLEQHVVPWRTTIDVDSLVELAASRSYLITADPADRARILDDVRSLGERVADAGGTLVLPYRTHAFRAVRP